MNWDKEVTPFPSNIISYSMHLLTIFDEDHCAFLSTISKHFFGW
jgi:hypothetical protein